MKIKNAYVNITSPGRNFVTLKIETDEGIYGLGESGNFAGDRTLIREYRDWLIGRDPLAITPFADPLMASGTPPGH